MTLPNTVLGSTVCVKNSVLGSTAGAINQCLLIKNSIAPGPNSKSGTYGLRIVTVKLPKCDVTCTY